VQAPGGKRRPPLSAEAPRQRSLAACCFRFGGDVRPREEAPTGGELTRFDAVGLGPDWPIAVSLVAGSGIVPA